MSNPLISVVIPYYKNGEFIEAAIASVRRQEYSPLEIIIIDDGSGDDIAERVTAWGDDIILLQQENMGAAGARNAGIRRARAEIIAFLDADDKWPDGKITLQLARLQAEPELDMISGRIQYSDLPGAEDLRMELEENNTLRHVHFGAALFRRRAFDIVGLFDEKMRFHEDLDWWMRAREKNINLVILKDVTLLYQRHGANTTRGVNMCDIRLIKMLKNSIDRRKEMHGGVTNLKPFSEYDDAS